MTHLSRSLPTPQARGFIIKRVFVPPQPPQSPDAADGEIANGQLNNVSVFTWAIFTIKLRISLILALAISD